MYEELLVKGILLGSLGAYFSLALLSPIHLTSIKRQLLWQRKEDWETVFHRPTDLELSHGGRPRTSTCDPGALQPQHRQALVRNVSLRSHPRPVE